MEYVGPLLGSSHMVLSAYFCTPSRAKLSACRTFLKPGPSTYPLLRLVVPTIWGCIPPIKGERGGFLQRSHVDPRPRSSYLSYL